MASPALTEYDVIFVGAGTSGGVAAGRLAVADPSLKILLVEAGPHVKDDEAFVQPAKCLSHLRADNPVFKVHVSEHSEFLGRQQAVTVPHVVGGGSSVNFTIYNRAVASDFDDWEKVHENPGWGAKDLVPLLRKTENYQVAEGKDDVHGYGGPINVSYGGKFTNVGKDFLDVAKEFDKTRTSTDDPNAVIRDTNHYGRFQKFIDGKTGKRSDVAHHFLYNNLKTTGLEILTGTFVKRVIFENKRATGIEIIPNLTFQPNADATKSKVIRAKRLVVISSGTFGSPQVLERSGIGAKSILEKAGVTQLVDLPGVGENFQDHTTLFTTYHATPDSDTLDGIGRGDPEDLKQFGDQFWKDGTGIMAHNGVDGGIKYRPSAAELEAIGPDFKKRWDEYFVGKDDKPVLWMCQLSLFLGDPHSVPARKYFTIGFFAGYPVSTGHVHIKDGQNPDAAIDFEGAYVKRPEDMAVMKFGYKLGREFARRMQCYDGEFVPGHPEFPTGSEATVHTSAKPVPVGAPRINYTAEDDKALEAGIRKLVAPAWHFIGTNAMKPRERGGVVDPKLNVYGVEGLKVCDISILPSNVCANTYSTALLVGEKGAVIIAEELGIQGV
uniref:Alcohol oxidase n=1 Tax=Irpex lacteus TaxID=5319 RepID=A0A0P0HJB2_IRPLA|nr:alcohol oxidase [Irpex lacteus]